MENEATGKDEEGADEDPTESVTQTRTTLTSWKPRVLQLHLGNHYRQRCGQCIRLDIRGSTNRLRHHQKVRDVVVIVSRGHFGVFTNLGRKDWNDVPAHIKKDIERVHRNLGYPSVQQMEKLIQEAKVSDEATEALKHFSCDARGRLKQPPAGRQVATG